MFGGACDVYFIFLLLVHTFLSASQSKELIEIISGLYVCVYIFVIRSIRFIVCVHMCVCVFVCVLVHFYLLAE